MTGEQALDWARGVLDLVDGQARNSLLYVADGENPVAALVKIRAFLYDGITRDNGNALAVVCLDRVIDTLRGFELRMFYERRAS